MDILETCINLESETAVGSNEHPNRDFEDTKLKTWNKISPFVQQNTNKNNDKSKDRQQTTEMDLGRKMSLDEHVLSENVSSENSNKAVLIDNNLEKETNCSRIHIVQQAENSNVESSKAMSKKDININGVIVSNLTTENEIKVFNHTDLKIDKIVPSVDNTDSESVITKLNKSFNLGAIIGTNTDDETKTHLVAETNIQKSRLALLCDSDSDEEPSNKPNSPIAADTEMIEQSHYTKKIKTANFSAKSIMKKPKTKNADTEIPKKMTPKQAAELRQEIQSESQRMMREKNISLPYHKPKSHSLKEFLARRPKLAVAVASGGQASPSTAIKMSNEQLEIISKKLKEREKEVKEFYKSESESENDDDLDNVSRTSDTNQLLEGANGTQKISQDLGNDTAKGDENDSNTNSTENIIRDTADKDKSLEENNEIESVVPNDIGDGRDIGEPGLEEVIKAKRSSEDEPIETSDITLADKFKENMDHHETVTDPCKNTNNNFSFEKCTEIYDFNLDDENTEQLLSSENGLESQQNSNLTHNLKKSKLECMLPSKSLIFTDFDTEIENFENPETRHNITNENCVNKAISPPVKTKLGILKEKLSNIKPRLSGGPDKVIDLDSTLAKPKEVVELMERFTKHMTSKKPNSKHKVKLSIVTVESGGDIHRETVAVNVENDDKTEVLEEKPGAKLHKLREELQKQMDQKKSEIWQQKTAKGMRASEEIYEDGEHSERESLYADEEEAEMTEEENSEEELEDDVEVSDKPLIKCGFLDEEAEESGEEETLRTKEYEEDTLNEEDKGETSEDIESENNEDSIMTTEGTPSEPLEPEHESSMGRKRILKRILQPTDDSDDEDLFPDFIPQKTTINEQLDSTVTADEDEIPPHQTRQLQTPMRQAVSQTKSISDFLTPISFITSIQNLASATKSNKNGPVISPFRMPHDQSPTTEERSTVSQRNLFVVSEVTDSQGSLDFPITQSQASLDLRQDNEIMSLQTSQLGNSDEPPCTQDLIGICSGEFTGVTQLESSDETRGQIEFDGSQNSELKCLGTDQDMVISQLLDEEELENFKKKFESPINPTTQRTSNGDATELIGGGIIDSDDEDQEEFGLRRKSKQRRIQFSDDESSDDEKDTIEEEIDLQDNDKPDEEEIDNIGYDSEENEIDFNETGKKIKLADFVDAEAELSESDWGSEDEDEKDMDKLEFELGDTDNLDHEQVKKDLEKIHLRRMLDDDAREIKLLQEVLLEDGEMHGTGRQRQFKWKNIDLNDDQPEEKKNDDEIYLDEEESEEHWRKKRHEREMFLKEKQHKNQDLFEDNLVNHSQLLKIGQKVLQRSQSQNNSQSKTPSAKNIDVPASPISKIAFNLSSKRGSFLSRSDQVLQRVTEYTKSTEEISVNSAKTTKNFVFQSVSASEVTINSSENKKRKAADGTPNVIKKLRLNTNFSPAVKKSERSKKLFNF